MTLGELIDRLETATGADRELDNKLYDAAGAFKLGCVLESYTASIDAIVALIERVLPGWTRAYGQTGSTGWCELTAPGGETVPSEGDTEALAICLAFVRALQTVKQPETTK